MRLSAASSALTPYGVRPVQQVRLNPDVACGAKKKSNGDGDKGKSFDQYLSEAGGITTPPPADHAPVSRGSSREEIEISQTAADALAKSPGGQADKFRQAKAAYELTAKQAEEAPAEDPKKKKKK